MIENIAVSVTTIICLAGVTLLLIGLLRLVHMKSCQRIDGKIVNTTQEYTSRGFMRKAQIEYEFNGKTYVYTTAAKTFKRHAGGTVPLCVNKKGQVVEFGQAIEFALIGIIALVISIILFALL